MPPLSDPRISEVRSHYEAGDSTLGLRRLLDVALDLSDASLQREVLAFCDWTDLPADGQTDTGHRERAFQLLEKMERAGRLPAAPSAEAVVSTKGLSKRYARGGFELQQVDLALRPGTIAGLVGQNGHGKTTLLRLLAGELHPDSGAVRYHFDEKPRDLYALRTKLVYIEQRIPRWYGPLMDNLQFTAAHYIRDSEAASLRAELLVARLGLRPFRYHAWKRISSGYRTRFEIARALLRAPRLLLLDEPLANLDIVAQQTLLQDLRFMAASLSRPFAMVLSSQHIYEVEKVSDQIIFLEKGHPRYQSLEDDDRLQPDQPLMLEIGSDASREAVATAFEGLSPLSLQYNGGVYLITFPAGTGLTAVWRILAEGGLEISYLRDISRSSRRFFAAS